MAVLAVGGSSGNVPPAYQLAEVNQQFDQHGDQNGGQHDRNLEASGMEGEGVEAAEGPGDQEFFVDPHQIQEALEQIKHLVRRIKEVGKLAKKSGSQSDIDALAGISGKVNEFKAILNSGNVGADDVQDFWESDYSRQIDEIDRRVRIPKEIAELKKALKRVEKLVSKRSKALILVKSVLGLNVDAITSLVDQIKKLVNEADSLVQSGNFEDVDEALQEIYQGGFHPGGIEGMIHELTNLASSVKKIKNQKIVDQIKQLIAEPFELIVAGDLQEAQEAFNEVRDDIYNLVNQGLKSGKKKYR